MLLRRWWPDNSGISWGSQITVTPCDWFFRLSLTWVEVFTACSGRSLPVTCRLNYFFLIVTYQFAEVFGHLRVFMCRCLLRYILKKALEEDVQHCLPLGSSDFSFTLCWFEQYVHWARCFCSMRFFHHLLEHCWCVWCGHEGTKWIKVSLRLGLNASNCCVLFSWVSLENGKRMSVAMQT